MIQVGPNGGRNHQEAPADLVGPEVAAIDQAPDGTGRDAPELAAGFFEVPK